MAFSSAVWGGDGVVVASSELRGGYLDMGDSVKAKAKAKVGPGIERAHTLPSEYYVDPAWHRQECERIFWRTWQCVLMTAPRLTGTAS